MSIKEAIAAFKQAAAEPERIDVVMLGELVGSCTDWAGSEDLDNFTYYYGFYPRSPTGLFPIGDIVVDWDEGLVYIFDGKEGEVTVNYENPVNLIEAIAKEL